MHAIRAISGPFRFWRWRDDSVWRGTLN